MTARGANELEPIFLNDWATENYAGKKGFEAMVDDFGITAERLEGVEILLASYTAANYEGYAFVLFRKDCKLYEVNGSHCSCHGLNAESYAGGDTQWQPEETTIEALEHRLEKGNLGSGWRDENRFGNELRFILEQLKKEAAANAQ
jgi:hypothetical protein